MASSNQCITCKNYLGFFRCAAFPESIPSEIFTGAYDHREEYEGDQGYRYDPIDSELDY